jgi:hypothetical protein
MIGPNDGMLIAEIFHAGKVFEDSCHVKYFGRLDSYEEQGKSCNTMHGRSHLLIDI